MKTLRTPDPCFENLPGYSFQPNYTDVPDGDGGTLRIHHVDEGPKDGPVVLCMHGQPTWSYLYRHMIPVLVEGGLRVIAPDLVGFGRSDKPAARENYTYQRQVDWLTHWLVKNDLQHATFFGQDWGGLIGLRMVAENPDRFDRVVISNTGLPVAVDVPDEVIEEYRRFRKEAPTPTLPEMMGAIGGQGEEHFSLRFAYWQKWCWETENLPVEVPVIGSIRGRQLTPEEVAAYKAPFPDPSYLMGPRAMPSQVPVMPDDPSIEANLRAWRVFGQWEKPFLTAFGDSDPVSAGMEKTFTGVVPGAKGLDHAMIKGGGHFIQEDCGEQMAELIIDFVKSN